MVDDSVVVVDDDESKIVTEFLLGTCRLRQPSEHHVQAAMSCSTWATWLFVDEVPDHTCSDNVHNGIPLTTGSSTELYIQPMLSCIGDVDIMVHRDDVLAIPEGYPPPTELPAEFHSCVRVYEIIDSGYPNYVYIQGISYLVTEDSNTSKYNAVWYHEHRYVHVGAKALRHGPALSITVEDASFDRVSCIRCLWWPPEAANWPTRHRDYYWPDSATVDLVVKIGCDVVFVAHPLCRQDEWMSKHQWRLSFSRAEIVLLNSWKLVQQIIYHMLRFFTKTAHLIGIRDSTGTKILSNYHLKTLTLWACEMKPQSWWTNDMNVVHICVKHLHIFSDWVKNKICPHYFVSNCNLFYDTVQLEIIISRLQSVTESWLSKWFVNNYFHKCAQLCPKHVSQLYDEVSTSSQLQIAASVIVNWRRKSVLRDLHWVCSKTEYFVSFGISHHCLTVQSFDLWINELKKIDSCLCDYFTATAFLQVASRIAKHSLSNNLLDILTTVVGLFVVKRRYCHQFSSELSLSQAAILMKVVANNSCSTVQHIEIELAKAYLHRALRCKDSDSDSIYCLANTYLAVLYYTTGQYQTAVDHCALVMKLQNHSKCTSHVVQCNLLPKSSNDIDVVLGLAVFYQYIQTAALNQRQTQYVSVFTTELFAHYLYVRCLSVIECCQFTQMLLMNVVQQHTKYIIDLVDQTQLFIADVLLLEWTRISKRKCHYQPLSKQRQYSIINDAELETTALFELLQQSAVEHLTTYRQLQMQRFGSLGTVVTTDFEALYAYERGDYQRCLQLSTWSLCTLLDPDDVLEGMLTLPMFIQLLDDDIVSLTALTLIVNPKCRSYSGNVLISQLTLSLYLMTQCQLMLRYSTTSLAQTHDYIEVAQRRLRVELTLDHLTLKLTERKVMIYLLEKCKVNCPRLFYKYSTK